MAHDALAVEDRDYGRRSSVKGYNETVASERDGWGREVVVVKGHDGVDAESERGDGVLLKHELRGHCICRQ